MKKYSIYGKILIGIGIMFVIMMSVGLLGVSNQAFFIEENSTRLGLSFAFAFSLIGVGAYLVKRKAKPLQKVR